MPTILVVDDSSVDRSFVGGLLAQQAGWTIAYAANGRAALEILRLAVPDIIVTDLLMPEIDGLQLLSAVRQRYPLLPVILMTSHGSEGIALEALRRGAASYVPKEAIPRDLRETVQRLLALSARQGSRGRLMGRMTKQQNTFRLENDPLLFGPLIQFLQDGAAQFGLWGDAERNRISVALEEALTNALYHGNLEIDSDLRERNVQAYHLIVGGRRGQSPYRERRIEVEAEFSADRAVFVVRDEGAGFDPTVLPDPTDPANLTKPSGRGILLMRAFMDEVTYNALGNSVALVKNREADHRVPSTLGGGNGRKSCP